MNVRRSLVSVLLAAAALHFAAAAPVQAAPSDQDKGLLTMIPRDAVFFLERRGHHAVREAFLASDLGKMAQDEVISQFVNDSRVRIGQMICKSMFRLNDRQEAAKYQKLLHGLLKPFWYEPCAMFLVLANANKEPQMGFICPTGQYRQECRDALEALMRADVPPKGTAGTRQGFTYEKNAVTWQCVAKGYEDFLLPEDPAKRTKMLKGKSLFMAAWSGRTLCVATGLKAADSLSGMLSLTQRGKSVLENESLGFVLKKTALKDWAFRWYADAEGLMKAMPQGNAVLKRTMAALGIDKILGMGGIGGYDGPAFVRMTYVYAPKAAGGLVRIFQNGGSYKKAHAMAPDCSSVSLAAQIDTKMLTKMIRDLVLPDFAPRREATTEPAGAPKPPDEEAQPNVDKRTQEVLKQIDLLAEASDGNVCGFVTELQGFLGMAMDAGPPIGAVMALKDPAKAQQAIDALLKLAGADERRPEPQSRPGQEAKPARLETYRNVRIRRAGDWASIAVMKDRAILALNDSALKATIDAALDGTGGFPPNSPGPKLAEGCGEGPGLFVMDLAAMTKVFWPLLVQLAGKAEQQGEDFPFASVPSAGKLARMLGPEVAVLRPEADGLMMSSRGKIPFATKVVFLYPFAGFLLMRAF